MNLRPLLLAAAALPAVAAAALPEVPAALAPATGEAHLMTLAARGVQVYECRASASGPAWAFVAPDAELLDEQRRPAGRHGAGPYWEASDGSRVVGAVKSRADAPAAGTIPWLLLATRDDGPRGRFSAVTSIQRVNTTGGAAPDGGCNERSVGTVARVPYTADYLLYGAR